MVPQQGQHPVFGPDLSGQHPLKLRETDKTFEQVHLPVQVPHRLEKRQHSVIAELPGEEASPHCTGRE